MCRFYFPQATAVFVQKLGIFPVCLQCIIASAPNVSLWDGDLSRGLGISH